MHVHDCIHLAHLAACVCVCVCVCVYILQYLPPLPPHTHTLQVLKLASLALAPPILKNFLRLCHFR